MVPKPKPNAFAFPRQQRQRSIAKILSPTPREQRQMFIAKLSPTSYRFFAGLLLFSFRLSSFSFHASGFRYLQYLWPHLTDVLGPFVKYILPLITGFLSPMAAQVADLFQQLVKTYCDAFQLSCIDSPPDCEPIMTTTTITLPNLPCPSDCNVTPSTITRPGPCSLVELTCCLHRSPSSSLHRSFFHTLPGVSSSHQTHILQ